MRIAASVMGAIRKGGQDRTSYKIILIRDE